MKVKEKMIGGMTMAQELIYTSCGYYLIPDIRLSYTSDKPLGIRQDAQSLSGAKQPYVTR